MILIRSKILSEVNAVIALYLSICHPFTSDNTADQSIYERLKTRPQNVLDDEADTRIVECAVAGNIEPVVTGDKTMPMLKKYRHISIIPLNEFLGKGK